MSCLCLLLAAWLFGQEPAWRLNDQFGRPHSAAELVGKPVLIIAGGAAAAKTFDAWIDAILASFGGPASSRPFTVVGIADIGNAPRIVHPLIRLRLPRDRQRPVLVDPNGTVSKTLHIERATSNQLVLARDGSVLLHLRGIPVDSNGVRRIVEQLRVAVRGAPADSARSR